MKAFLRCYLALALLLAPLLGAQASIGFAAQKSIEKSADITQISIQVDHQAAHDCHESIVQPDMQADHQACDASKHLCCLASLYLTDTQVSLIDHFTQGLQDQFHVWSLKTFLEPLEHPPKTLS